MSDEALERYQHLKLRESLSLSDRYPLVCNELGVILRLGFSKSPKPLQSLLFEDTIAAFRLLPQMQTQSAVSAANHLSQSAAAALPKQKRGLAATEFKQAKVAYKRRLKTQQEKKDLVQLPQDVLVHLFSFLDMQSLVSAGIVCWSWNTVANDNYLWQLHYITHFGDGEIIPKQKGHQSRNFCEDANYDWKEAFRREYLGLPSWRNMYNRGFCGFCNSIVWLNNLNCPKAHLSTIIRRGFQPLKPLPPRQELTEEVSKMKTNIEIVTQHHLSKLLRLKAKGNQVQDVGQSSNSPTLSQWYSDPKVMEEIDEIMDRIRVVKKRTADIDLPSFDLGISDLEKTPSPAPKLAAKKRGKKKI